ncbi:MAG TPA: alpha-2-macroglobulin family protein [bacterium]|nr:alpha-2-macroglobulin family protein [bacterium]
MAEYAKQKAEAERLGQQGSYSKAHEIWAGIDAAKLPKSEKKWVEFRRLDTEWRTLAGSSARDNSKIEKVREKLAKLLEGEVREEDRDRAWAETEESLGDYYWLRSDNRNWWQAWQYYQAALDWWAGANVDLELARTRYLAICWKAERPPEVERYYYYGYYGNTIPQPVLENCLEIAKDPDDKARAHYLLAMTLRNSGDYESVARASEEFEAALSLGKKTDWYDDALYNYANTLENYGRAKQKEDGSWTREPDYVGALALYRRLLSEFKKGDTRWWDEAKSRSEEIVRATLSVSVSNIFLPDSQIAYYLSWRNVGSIEMALHPVDLGRDIHFRDGDSGSEFLERIDLSKSAPIKTWTKKTDDDGTHKPGTAQERLDVLPPGAYVLVASGKGLGEAAGKPLAARELVLVTDTTVVVTTAPSKLLAWTTDAGSGVPVGGTKTVVFERHYADGKYRWKTRTGTADKNGLAVFDRGAGPDPDNGEFFVATSKDGHQAFSLANGSSRASASESWRIYAYTDRPAYRPGDTAQWKFIARVGENGAWSTPAKKKLEWEIHDPQGAKVGEGSSTLNAFGAAWGELALTEKMPLGEYQIEFWDEGRHNGIGNATLLRLEEYKLPEFVVSVKTPEENGRRKTYLLGEKVTASIEANYYFGGAVADADVEVLVYQSPYYAYYSRPRDYPWFYEDMSTRPYYYGYGGSVIKQEKIKTDSEGKAQITFDTPRGAGQDFEYRVEARVVDSSRREVHGTGSVKVTRQRFSAFLEPRHYLYQPKDKATFDLKTLDPNGEPYPAEGTLEITRDHWWEVWLDPKGNEVKGDALKKARLQPGFGGVGWRLKMQGYQHDAVETRTVKTNAEGSAEIEFTPDREGYYRLAWTCPQKGRNPVKTETWVWVATPSTTELGYRQGGLQVLVDSDTVRAGTTAPVMLSVPQADRWVLFSVEADDLYHYEVVHLEGSVKLLQLKVEDNWIPNVFLSGRMVQANQVFEDTKQVVVPPVDHFLDVSVTPDRTEYEARDQATYTVTTRDAKGHAVSAEVGLSVADESVFAIQEEIAGDPRQFYFGTKRGRAIYSTSTFNQKSYAKLGPEFFAPAAGVRAGNEEGEAADESEAMDDRKADAAPGGGGQAFGALAAPSKAAASRSRAPSPTTEAAGKKLKDAGADRELQKAPAAPPPPPNGATGGGGGEEPAVQVRTDFRATAFWQPDVVTDADGHAKVTFKWPDSLTGWRATARAASTTAQFGIGTSTVKTRLPLLVRLQGPRFFVVGDVPLVSGVANNNTDKPISAELELTADGVTVKETLVDGKKATGKVTVPPHGEARVDWRVDVPKEGEAKLKVVVKGAGKADAMEKTFPIFEHGVDKLVAKSGKVRGDGVKIELDLPKRRSTELTVQVAPSLAVTMLDALPYLIDYPYGCTEQTMSRFLPAVIVRKTLTDTGLDAKQIEGKVFGGIEQDSASKTHPKGKQDLRKLDDMTEEGLKRLYDFHHSDGGWGWWKEGASDRFMTAYVVWGMALARDAGVKVNASVLDRGANFLQLNLVNEEGNLDRQAWMLHALSAWRAGTKKTEPSKYETRTIGELWKAHTRMNAYSRSLFALALSRYGMADKAKLLVENLENGAKKDEAPDTSVVMEGGQKGSANAMATAHWGEDGFWWRWSDSPVETTSFALMALATIDPKNPLVESSMNWLVKNRRGSQWSNTKDTAIAVLALNQYLKTSGELGGDLEYALTVNGKEIAKKKVTKKDVLSAPSRFAIDPALVKDANEIRLKKISGDAPLYFSAEARFFSLEEPVTPAGNELFLRRKYFKKSGRRSLLKGYVYDTSPLEDGGKVGSGDRIEVVVTVETKNDYEYLLFEDLKPAGFEAVEVKSGQGLVARAVKETSLERNYGTVEEKRKDEGIGKSTDEIDYTGESASIYEELRDRKVALFAEKLKAGVWEIRYELRAEVPGTFHALPVLGHAMYVPEIRANGAEIRVEVLDRE